MKIRTITALREFDALESLWREMVAASNQTSPFVSHDWFACCWRTAGPNRRRELWMIENGGGPVAFVPLVYERARFRGLPARTVRLLQSPDTPFTDFPVAGDREAAVRALLHGLGERRDWDVAVLDKLVVGSAIHKAFDAELADAFPSRVASVQSAPYVAVSGTWEEFFHRKTPRFRKTLRNVENRIRREGEVAVEEHRHVDPGGPLFSEVLEVSRQSWKGPRGLAMATMQEMPRFFREFTLRASANGWLHLWMLRINGRAVATEYQVSAGGCVHALRSDFDASYAAASPGAYLNAKIVQALFERRGVHEYDMGPGDNPYKLRWATGLHQTVGIEVYAPTTYGKLLHGLETRLVPLARRVRAALSRRSA